jgi:hypothetical protein
MHNKKIRWLVFVWLSGLTLVYADDFFKVKEKIIAEARAKKFSLYISPTISLTNFGYSTNIFAYQEIEEPDWTADVGIDFSIAAILKDRFILVVNEFPYYSFYARNKSQEAFNNRFQFTTYTHLGRFNLDYKLNLNNVRLRPNSEFGIRTRRREENHALSLDYGRHDRFFVNIYVARNHSEYTEERYLDYDLSHLDRDATLLGIILNKRIFSRTRLLLNYEYYGYKFPNAPGKDGMGGKLLLGVDFPEIGRITGSLRFGFNSFFPKNPGYSHFSKPIGSGNFTIRMLKRFKFQFNYIVGNFFSFWTTTHYFDERSAEAGVEYYLSRRMKVGYRYRTGRLSYKSLADGSEIRQDDYHSTSWSIGFRISRKMGIGLAYTLYRADSSLLAFTRKYNFIGGYITHEF